MLVTKGDKFTCAYCGRLFEADRDHDDAWEEAVNIWGEEALTEGVDIICDECFREFITGEDEIKQ